MASKSASVRRRPIHWKAAAPESLPGTLTATLEDTVARLKESLKPIAWSEDEYNAVAKKIDTFAATKGPELHERLLGRAAERPHWLEEWWDDAGYLGYRDSVVVNVSYYYGFDSQPSHLPQSPAGRAAGIARSALIFRQKLKQGLIKPESTKEGPICMDTYRWMFDCCRVPAEGLDYSISYAKQGDSGDLDTHIVVIRKNRVWKLDAIRNGKILSTQELERQIQYIYNNTLQEYPGVGVLTASNRDVWAKDYTELTSQTHNAKIVEAIHSSAFVIALDSSRPTDPIHHSRALWHGDIIGGIPVGLRNRWVDKPVQFIVFDNAYAGLMGEHSVMDGTPTARMCDEVLDMLYDPAFDHGKPVGNDLASPTPLDWEVTPETAQAIDVADKAAAELSESILRLPDSWAQMIVQLAYRRLLGDKKRTGGTYEAASTRKFYKGRTEAIRVVTSEADAWVESMDDPSATSEIRKQLFDQATKKHVNLAKAGGQGQGVDRHLFGLKKVLKEGEALPEMYSDPVFQRSSNWVLSTSAIFSKHFPVYGWGEVVPDGFGVAYMTGYDGKSYSNDYRLQYTITSRKEMPNAEFVQEIAKAADDIYKLHKEVATHKGHRSAKL
ncbi:carnitine acetyl transferase [Pholiota molesta]|nr:carnitine acetyl transferase [Pholiota molesta]